MKDKIKLDYKRFMRRPGSPARKADFGDATTAAAAEDVPWAEILPQEDQANDLREPQSEYSRVAWEDLYGESLAEIEPIAATPAALDPPPLPFLLAAAWMLFALLAI
ncbi:MAG: hypothetical protein FJ118_10200 [Deltaproteobacteria bacterium]|nr:hypothetical protein [Deltaproteobacteria bacterium]